MPDDNEKAYQSVILAPRNTQRAIELAFYHIGKAHMAELSRQMLAKDKKGRVYIRRDTAGRRRRHRASAPGQTAANWTGNMRRGRSFEVKAGLEMEFGVKGVRYAAYLERGTARVQPRPSVGNTVKAEEKNTEATFYEYTERRLT